MVETYLMRISLQGGFPAQTCPKPESEPDSRMRTARRLAAAFGLSSPVSLGRLDLDTSSLRTSQACLFTTECEELSESFPDAGMWGSGDVYELQSSAPLTSESACSSSPCWPSPTASDQFGKREVETPMGNGVRRVSSTGSHFGKFLNDAAATWPTPNTKDSASAARHTTTTGIMHPGTTLTDAIRLWPTPHQNCTTGPGTEGRDGGENLQTTVDLWQTPGTDSFRSRGGDRKDEMGLDQQARNSPFSHPAPQTNDGPTSCESGRTSRRRLVGALIRALQAGC